MGRSERLVFYIGGAIAFVVALGLVAFAVLSSLYMDVFDPGGGANIGGGIAIIAAIPIAFLGCVSIIVGAVQAVVERIRSNGTP
ncbi:hypothetical protein NBM05_04100 [Rothia sp. AR01]|uniref:Uncharacterized protein n=1 Tax=Rothia santali TaxID=2949643 RepID=A0A9X2KHW8_9MICC|nr:hypothetical protein [Rothia santali]MCP3425229.1 hypothetical protein [Rothia santali]